MEKKEINQHLAHCYQGEYKTTCKYGDENCPAKPKEEKGIDFLMVEDIENKMGEMKEELGNAREMILNLSKQRKAFMNVPDEKFGNYNKIMHLVNSFFGVEYQRETFSDYKKKINEVLDKQQELFCFVDCVRSVLFAGRQLEEVLKEWKKTDVNLENVKKRLKEHGFE